MGEISEPDAKQQVQFLLFSFLRLLREGMATKIATSFRCARPPALVCFRMGCVHMHGVNRTLYVCEWGRRLSVITFELCVWSLCAALERRGITFNPPNVVYLSAIMETCGGDGA